MKAFGFVLCVPLLAALWATPVLAAGAMAVGAANNLGAHGVAVGMSGDMKTSSAATIDALTQCKSANRAKASIRALCHIVSAYSNQCSAVAMDPKAGAPGLGWAVASSSSAASRWALANCRATAGFGRGRACVVAATSCDGSAK